MIELRPLGRTATRVTSLGFGTGPIGKLLDRPGADEQAEATLAAAWESGIRYFDTAPLYGLGRSEVRLGRFLRSQPRAGFTVSTKVGRLLTPAAGSVAEPTITYDYSHDGTLRSLEASLTRLGLDRIDIALVHDIDRWTHGAAQPQRLREALDGALPALLGLRAEGVIGAVGIGVNEWQVCRDVVLQADIDCVLLAGRYTLLEQEPARELLPLCRERGIGVIIGGPFNSGILAAGAGTRATYNYGQPPPHVVEKVEAITRALRPLGVGMPTAALRFPLLEPAVVSVIPGLAEPAEVAAAVASLSATLPDDIWQRLKAAGLLDAAVAVGQ